MKKTLITAALLAAMAVPAMAQPPGFYGPPPGPGAFWYGAPQRVSDRIEFLSVRIQRMRAAGKLSEPTALQLGRDLDQVRIQDREMRARDGGELSPPDRRYLWRRLQNISSKLNWDSHWGY